MGWVVDGEIPKTAGQKRGENIAGAIAFLFFLVICLLSPAGQAVLFQIIPSLLRCDVFCR